MHPLYMIALFVLFITGLNGTVTFTSPRKDDTWTVGQTQSISWTQINTVDNPNGNYLSVRLYQVFPNNTVTAYFQYLIQQAVPDTVNVNPAGWPVQLDRTVGISSSVSNKYILALYLETQTNVLAQSHIFTIKNTTVRHEVVSVTWWKSS